MGEDVIDGGQYKDFAFRTAYGIWFIFQHCFAGRQINFHGRLGSIYICEQGSCFMLNMI